MVATVAVMIMTTNARLITAGVLMKTVNIVMSMSTIKIHGHDEVGDQGA